MFVITNIKGFFVYNYNYGGGQKKSASKGLYIVCEDCGRWAWDSRLLRKPHCPCGRYLCKSGSGSKVTFNSVADSAWHGWEELFKHDLPWLQLGDVTVKRYTKWKETATFRDALKVLSKAKLFVGTDGGLHHAAATLGIPSVVIWTGFTSPRHLGYDTHRNIHDGSEPCGTYDSVCQHCLLKSKAITVEQVLDAVNTEWHRTQR